MLKVRKREEEREREEEGGGGERGRKRGEREGGRDEGMIKELLALEKLERITIMVTLFQNYLIGISSLLRLYYLQCTCMCHYGNIFLVCFLCVPLFVLPSPSLPLPSYE